MWILAAMQYTETPLSLHQCINITGYMQHRDSRADLLALTLDISINPSV